MPSFTVQLEWSSHLSYVDVKVEADSTDQAIERAMENVNYDEADTTHADGDTYVTAIEQDGVDIPVPVGYRDKDVFLTPVEQHAEEMKALLEEIVGGGWNIMALPTPRARVAQLLAKIAAAK